MRKLALLLVLAASLAGASTAAATPPAHFRFPMDQTFRAPFTSAFCGFDVFITFRGTAQVTLFFDGNGVLRSEIDTFPALKITWSAPSTGKSFSYPSSAVLLTTYTNGGIVGSSAVASLVGLDQNAGPQAVDAGRLVFNAVVIDISPEGIPLIDFVGDPIFAAGTFTDNPVAARCAALSDP